jgi:hypothetical protein
MDELGNLLDLGRHQRDVRQPDGLAPLRVLRAVA